MPELLLHGQKRLVEMDSKYTLSDSVLFRTYLNDISDTGKVFIEKIDGNTVIFADSAIFGNIAMAAEVMLKTDFGNYKPIAIFYWQTSSKKIALKQASGGVLRRNQGMNPYTKIMVEMSPSAWFNQDLRENGRYYFYSSTDDVRLFTHEDCKPSDLLWPDENRRTSEYGEFYNWDDFHDKVLIQPYLYYVYKPGKEKKWFRIEYVNNNNAAIKKWETFEFSGDRFYNDHLEYLKNDLGALCDCKQPDQIAYNECIEEANYIAEDYLIIWCQNANSWESYGYKKGARVQGQPGERMKTLNNGEINSGWYCYQWTYLLHSQLCKRSFRHFFIQLSGYLGKDSQGVPGENMKHNWLTVFTCDSSMGRNTDNGVHLDFWVGNIPNVYNANEHFYKFQKNRNFISVSPPNKTGYKGVWIDENGNSHDREGDGLEW